ncbi:uncharacterized protein LOC118191355 isoform X2 [Stegodyphus dumicola]|uniref:uncharacterized protein LOC118191355 isoform X2 n=1 Tax=Stegodyphus dumicola TaxID=202533 RepID=UPI0015A825D5|nr:uncharacterized protein LOC118191355 isoform X2 [Stegodyphus dumicola]
MELTEEMKTCISLAQTLSLEAQNMPENFKKDKQEAMQHLGALLASNCQKICIGPSFHLYASEGTVPGSDKSSEMSDNRIRNSTEVIVEEDGEEFETIFYHGSSITQESNSIYECQNDTKPVCDEVDKSDSISLTPMNIKLAQATTEYGGLLSPDFFQKNFDISSSASSRYSDSSSGIGSSSESPAGQLEQTQKQKAAKLPFVFPKVATSEYKKPKGFQDNLSHVLERVEIIDSIKEETKETTWEEWPKKFIEENGFCLGVEPGNFYKSSTGPFFYVAMPHRSGYEILVTNNKQVACDVDIFVDGKPVAALRLSAGDSRAIDGPTYAEFAFKLFRSKDAPPGLGVVEGNIENGVLKAVFTPQKVRTSKERAFSEPLSELNTAERSFDISEVVEGATLLQGPKKKRLYVPAPPMEVDISKQVTLILRLVASTKKEVEASNEKVSCLQPPPLPSRRER